MNDEKRTKVLHDKSTWPPGPWSDEPDRVEFRHKGFPCLMLRARGHWCGYVAVPPGHAAHGKDYYAVDVQVHGGLTFASECEGEGDDSICHVPAPGEPDNVWWLGFDCHHHSDFGDPHILNAPEAILSDIARSALAEGVYRTAGYVAEVRSLADQLAEMKAEGRR